MLNMTRRKMEQKKYICDEKGKKCVKAAIGKCISLKLKGFWKYFGVSWVQWMKLKKLANSSFQNSNSELNPSQSPTNDHNNWCSIIENQVRILLHCWAWNRTRWLLQFFSFRYENISLPFFILKGFVKFFFEKFKHK